MTSEILVDVRDRIAVVRIYRPESRNALNVEAIEGLRQAALSLASRRDVGCVIVTGTPEFFCAGADRKDDRIFRSKLSTLEQWHLVEAGSAMAKAWEALPQVTIAAIEGFVIGGGFTLAMACDFRVMGRSAFVQIPEVPLGFNYGWNSIPRMVSLAGPSRTKRAVLLGERITAEQAEQWGLADYVVADGGALDHAQSLAAQCLALPQLPVQFSKRAVNALVNAPLDSSSHADMAQILLCLKSAAEETGA